jgi:predicted dinucleotide-binding enzyme
MKIGFMGAGEVAQTIAKHLLPFGHQVMLSNSRGPDSLADVVKGLGAGATAGTLNQVAEQDIVVLATSGTPCSRCCSPFRIGRVAFSSIPPIGSRVTRR